MIKNTFFLLCAVVTASLSQNGPAFRSNVEIVAASCAVLDASGAPVGGLTRDEFRVYDNDIPRVIENLWIDTDEPLTLGVIVDASESQKEQLSEHRQTALQLLERILQPGDHTFVLSVDEDIRLWVDLTDATAGVRRQIAGSPGDLFGEPCPKRQSNVAGLSSMSACGSSPIWNAIYEAAKIKLHSLSGNKALLVLTDGDRSPPPLCSRVSAGKAEWQGSARHTNRCDQAESDRESPKNIFPGPAIGRALVLSFRSGNHQPEITDTEAGESGEPKRLVSRVFESRIGMRIRLM